MRVAVVGSRSFTDKQRLFRYLDKFHEKTPITIVLCGMAKGPDLMGKEWADLNGVTVWEYPAEWDKHGKSAGFIRNGEMARNTEVVIAVWDGVSNGTNHMIRTSKLLDRQVIVLKY